MNSTTRLSAMIGAGLLTGIVAAAPAQAAPAPPPRDHVTAVAYFVNRLDCDWVGRAGDAVNRWDDPHCLLIGQGPHRGMWLLTVQSYGSLSHGWPGLPGLPGHPRAPGRPGAPGHPGGPGH